MLTRRRHSRRCYNSTDAEKTVDGVMLSPRQKAKARNAYIAPYRIDYSKDNGSGKGVFIVE
ncbi:MAG: hypothetical protein IKW80_04240 [Thermoguttaceae bacterium]|nr:hypothetical protein [Thermoguttaceae bacterium]